MATRPKVPTQARPHKAVGLPPHWQRVDAGLRVVPGKLPPPMQEFHAAALMVERVSGTPTVWFAQTAPGSARVVAAVGLALAHDDLINMLQNFGSIAPRLHADAAARSDEEPLAPDFESLPPSSVRLLPASLTLAVVSTHRVMIDFYNVEMLNSERHDALSGGAEAPSVTPQVRVYLSPSLMLELIRQVTALLEAT